MSKQEKSVRWLNKSEAILLDLPPKENDGKRKQNRYRLTSKQWREVNIRRDYNKLNKNKPMKPNSNNVLVIGDLHEPFCLKEYLAHCKSVQEKYNCSSVVFIGDVIDNHYSSYHESDPNGLSGGDELTLAINKLQRWYKAFPKATVTIGNHDRLIRRKAFSGGIPKQWIKEYAETLDVPKWVFTDRLVIDNVQYIHGESGRATKKAKDDMMSTVQGHRHTEMFTEFIVGANFKVFGCAVGCGVDNTSYAMAYGKNFKKPAIGCAVVFGGEYAINIPMDL